MSIYIAIIIISNYIRFNTNTSSHYNYRLQSDISHKVNNQIGYLDPCEIVSSLNPNVIHSYRSMATVRTVMLKKLAMSQILHR